MGVCITVLVPAYNAARTLESCLHGIQQSVYQDHEILVVDDGSTDHTVSVAERYADRVIKHKTNRGLPEARRSAYKIAKADLIVNLDADVILPKDALGKIIDFFKRNPGIDAAQASLSKENPGKGYFSRYKALYMHFLFSGLPSNVRFLHGSCFVIRKSIARLYSSEDYYGEDTNFGQKLLNQNKKIGFLKDVEVVHLKEYTLPSFYQNDFKIPFYWVSIFIQFKGWSQLGKNKIGFAHSPKEQLLSVMLVPSIILLVLMGPLLNLPDNLFVVLFLIWFLFNLRFFLFLTKERGIVFGLAKAIPVTFLDHLVMATGIICGFISYFFSRSSKNNG